MKELSIILNDLLINKFFGNTSKFFQYLINAKELSNLRKAIVLGTAFIVNPIFSQRVYHILHNLSDVPKCYCGKFAKYLKFSKGYQKHCSSFCSSKNNESKELRKATNLKKFGYISPIQNKDVQYKMEQTNIERYGVKYPIQNKIIKEKIKKINLERYGYESSIQNKDILDKVKQTNIERYGYENVGQNEIVKQKIKDTFLKRYGYENVFQNETVKEKIKQVNLEKYGVENSSQRKEVQEKKNKTNLEKYGYYCSSKNEDVKNKSIQTNLKKYNVKFGLQNKDILDKVKQTNIERYGTEYSFCNKIVKDKLKQTNIKNYGVNYPLQNENIQNKTKIVHLLNSYNRLKEKFKDKFEFLFVIDNYTGVKKLSYKFRCLCCDSIFEGSLDNGRLPRCLTCYPLNAGISFLEKSVADWLSSLSIKVIENNNFILKSKEIDIYLPDHNIAIEFNGMYWHSELKGKNKKYHLDKTEECLKKGIQLIHIFEDEWILKQDIVKSIILSKLGKCDKIFARKTVIKIVEKDEAINFIYCNHLQDNSNGIQNYYGLYYNDELVQLIGIGRSRYNKNYDYELIRSCTKLNNVVVGGFCKLIKNLPCKGSLISYVDRRYFTGNGYKNWTFIGKTDPNYYYLGNNDYLNKQSRLKFQKHKLPKLFPDVYDIDLTEWEIMQLAGYNRIWDCGNLVYSISL